MTETPLHAAESSAEDEAVIRQVLAGNTNAFAKLERKYRRIVTFLVRKMVSQQDDVADLVQDTFVKAFQALPTFQFEFPFSRWLYKIASNRCIDYLRRRRFAMVSIDQPITGKDGSDYVWEPRDSGPTPESVVLSRERAQMIRDALASMPEKYQVVIRMRHDEELEYQEIADRLGQPLGTVKANLFRARKRLVVLLKRHGRHFEEYMADEEDE